MSDELPLANKRIVVTRSEEQADPISSGLAHLGASVLLVPTIKILPVELSDADERKIASYYSYDVVAFSSPNGVKHCLSRIPAGDGREVKPYIIAVGTRTAGALREFGVTPDFIPQKFSSAELVRSLAGYSWKSKKLLLPSGNLGGDELRDFAASRGALVDRVIVYMTVPNDLITEEVRSQVISGMFDVAVFYSPSQVKYFIDLFGVPSLNGKDVAVIGPTTMKALESFGIAANIVPSNATTEDLITSLVEYEKIGE